MTAAEIAYLAEIESSFGDYTYSLCVTHNTHGDNTLIEKYKQTLLSYYVEIMNYYLRDTVTGDEDIMTTAEAETVMDHINNITGQNDWLTL